MGRTWTVAVVAVVALALLAAGCGDDDGDGAGEAEQSGQAMTEQNGQALSKEEFIAEANAICAEGDAALGEAAAERFGDSTEAPPRAEQEDFISGTVADEFEAQRDQIAALTPPEEDQEQIDSMLSALDDLVERARNDPGSVLDASEVDEASQLAREYGLTDCGN